MKRIILIADLISALLLLLFLYTAISKLNSLAEFRLTLAQSPFLKKYAFLLAWSIPIIEILISVLLFFPAARTKGLYASLVLLLVFTGYIAAMLLEKQTLPCSCGGVISTLNWPQHLVFNVSFLLLSITALLLYKKQTHNKTPP